MMESKKVGIIGGMGPKATVDLMNKIINNTPAKHDQDHLHLIVDSNSQIPDRTSAIIGEGLDPTPSIVASAQRLQKAGADLLMIACNTAHFFYKAVIHSVDIPVIHMPIETAKYLQEHKFKRVGLLATDGTLQSNLYQHCLNKYDIALINSNKDMQAYVMKGIYSIKGGKLETGLFYLSAIAKELKELGADAIIAGCTEIPLVLQSTKQLIVVDPTEIIAKKVVHIATNMNNELLSV
ncbi:amino acid racemase [Bacillus sp. SM2101]|uniref:aspartate/glutamate racemase family protein n=1 Tax=Bacillus sp. SM2101 TaxID=2805366 RepID=UPI001BDE840A|nr:amino acid racemase [Bacillus sp. SM2101]